MASGEDGVTPPVASSAGTEPKYPASPKVNTPPSHADQPVALGVGGGHDAHHRGGRHDARGQR